MLCIRTYRIVFTSNATPTPNLFMGSAWRGALGHVLMQQHPDCYPYLFETPVDHLPEAVRKQMHGSNAPHPFLVSPAGVRPHEQRYEHYVDLHLYGKGIDYAPQMISSLHQAGRKGIYDEQYINAQTLEEVMNNAEQHTLEMHPEPPAAVHIQFLHPLRLREGKQYTKQDQLDATLWVKSLLRRYQQLDCAHSNEPDDFDYSLLHQSAADLSFQQSQLDWFDWYRYSSRQKKKVPMGGIVGSAILEGEALDLLWPMVWLGQWLHAGKGAAMGLGKYRLLNSL
jgi:hypothetical protein